MNPVKVIIPIYKTSFSEMETKALENNLRKLSRYPIVVVCPQSLEVVENKTLARCKNLEIERFSDHFFKGVEMYNRLMLSEEFYARFSDTEYILICQTDAFVFRDELLEWCNKGYDYIGAPWLGTIEKGLIKIMNQILVKLKLKKHKDRSHLFKVGNGGFSLRKVSSALRIIKKHQDLIDSYLNNPLETRNATEDVFWSFRAPELVPFIIPDYKEALLFAMDRRPDMGMRLTNGELPFACHGFTKEKIYKYWRSRIIK